MSRLNVKYLQMPKHLRDSIICSTFSDTLKEQYGMPSTRVIKGDTVRVMRGEYSGIEGKVDKINTERGTLAIEGIQREKIRGGNVKVQIHASNVLITGLNLGDKYRQTRLSRNSQTKSNTEEKIKLSSKDMPTESKSKDRVE
jgi:large subunit ribosomal protein L24